MEPTVLIPAIVSVAGAVVTYLIGRQAKQKTKNEADNVVVGSAEQSVAIMMRQLTYFESEVVRLQEEIKTLRLQVTDTVAREMNLRSRIEALENYIVRHGLELPQV